MEIYTPKPKIKLSPVVRNGREFVEVTFGNDNDIRLSLSKEENVLLVGGRAYLPAENFVLAEFFDRYVKMAFIDYSAIKETAPRKEEDKRPPLPEGYLEKLQQVRYSDHTVRVIRNATRHVEEVESGHKRIASEITALQSEIEGVRRKVFDEVFGFIDERNAALNRGIRVGKEDIQAAACAIDTLQATIRELDEAASPDLIQSLKDTLRETRGKSNEAAGRKTAVDARVRALEIQRERFVQFKTYLANTKIEALSRITNEFLQDIGSDIRIRFDGYTVLKSGKVREKISISLLRDGMDCGSFGKFSAGEAARVNLATILAMQKLVNSNCDGDKGLDLLVLDEILEAVDEAGLASMFEALNSLGGTVLVVSHGNVAEGYPHKLVIVKENGESRLGE